MTASTGSLYIGVPGRSESFLMGFGNVYAGDGNDYISVSFTVVRGPNPVVVSGGAGSDVIDYYTGLNELNHPTFDGGTTIWGDANIDDINSSDGAAADHILGGITHDTIFAGGGDDYVNATLGHDEIRGGSGNDYLLGGLGADTIFGDTGNDTIYGGTPAQITRQFLAITTEYNGVTDGSTPDINVTGLMGPLAVDDNSPNHLYGGAGNDIIVGGLGADVLDGGIDNDTLTGNGGNDTLTGGLGQDTLNGGLGNDTLVGGENNDLLIGGTGRDLMNGGANNDIFRFTALADSTLSTPDLITDFDDIGNDTIDVSALFGAAMAYRHNLAFTAAGQVRISDIAGADLLVQVNTGGTLAADFTIRLTNTTPAGMTGSDFIL